MSEQYMHWIKNSKKVFTVEKPVHFTNYQHCSECFEHDETLRNSDVDTITLEALGHPGWDPITFSTTEGILYYAPALVRVSLETADSDFYFDQFLGHLTYGGEENRLFQACSPEQRAFIASFIGYMIEHYPGQMDDFSCADDALFALKLWRSGADSQ